MKNPEAMSPRGDRLTRGSVFSATVSFSSPNVTLLELALSTMRATFSHNRWSGVDRQRVAIDALTNVRARECQFESRSGARV